MRLRGRDHRCTDPELVDKGAAAAAATGWLREVVQRMDFAGGYLRLRHD